MKYNGIEISEGLLEKCRNVDTKLNQEELKELGTVYEKVQANFGRKRKLSVGCTGCIITALKTTANWAGRNPQPTEDPRPTVVELVGLEYTEMVVEGDPQAHIADVQGTKVDYNAMGEMKLKTLRALYPDIKSTSVKGFIEKLKEKYGA